MEQQSIERKNNEYISINCCSQGPTISQILAIGLFLGIQIISFNLIPQMLHLASGVMYALMAFSYGSLVFLAVQYARLSKSDPSDPRLYNKDYHETEVKEKKCEICQCMVSETSHHCQNCERCAEEFDHHCVFVNNCIGKGNYPIFIRLLIAIILHTSTNMGIFTWLFLTLKDSYKWLSLSFGILNSIVFVQVTVLALFHCYISFCLYKTTLQWIKGDKEDSHTIRIVKGLEFAENTNTELMKMNKNDGISSRK